MPIIYGPVRSWRLGRSLGIDPICRHPKVCSFNCSYCQLGAGGMISTRKCRFLSTENLVEELNAFTPEEIDVVTFSGTGEPMLASNLREMGGAIRARIGAPMAILTNSGHLLDDFALETLANFDIVVAKLDAATEETFKKINRPHYSIGHERILEGIHHLKRHFRGSLRLQCMFIEDNLHESGMIADLCREIDPDTVYINTPLRPCSIHPLDRNEIDQVKKSFSGLNTESVF